jgi:peptidoglycan/LPS O-acetylase OafA/YrhL
MATTTPNKPTTRHDDAPATIPTPASATTPTVGVPSATPTKAPARILPLDGLRTFAIIVVVLYHLHFPHMTGGFVGVNVFFVLSGYLITSLLLKEHARTATIRLGRFWGRRVLRLYPTLIAVVIVGVSLWFLVGTDGSSLSAGAAALIALTYTGNFVRAYGHLSQGVFAPSWSLAMEEQFYLVWPPVLSLLLWRGFRRRTVGWVLTGLVVASCALGWLLYVTPGPGATPDIYFSPVTSVAPLLTGCVLALALTHERVRIFFSGWAGSVSTLVGMVGIIVTMCLIRDDWKEHALMFGLVLPSVGFSTALLIAGLASRATVLGRILSFAPFAWFGRNVSYSLYLWHMLVMSVLTPALIGLKNDGLTSNLIILAAAIVVSIGSHYAIERPFLRLKTRLEPSSWSSNSAPARSTNQPTVESLT